VYLHASFAAIIVAVVAIIVAVAAIVFPDSVRHSSFSSSFQLLFVIPASVRHSSFCSSFQLQFVIPALFVILAQPESPYFVSALPLFYLTTDP